MGHRRALLVRIAWRCLAVYVVATVLVTVMTSEFYQTRPGPKQAREDGRFIKFVRVEPPYVEWRGDRYPVLEAWIERRIRLQWHFLFAPWLVTDYHGFYFTIGHGERTDSLFFPYRIHDADSAIGYDDSLPAHPIAGFANEGGWRLTKPFPERMRVHVLPRSAPQRSAPD